MNITIVGAGNMGRGIATRLAAGGHAVTFVSNDPAKAEGVATEIRAARPGARVNVANLGEGLGNEIVVLALPYAAAREFAAKNAPALAGKTVVDISNPLNGSYDGLVTESGTSAAEEIAALLPKSNVVKAFNTTFAGTLVSGAVDGHALDVFVASNDDDGQGDRAPLRQRWRPPRHRRRQARTRAPARGSCPPRHHPPDAARPRFPERLEAGRVTPVLAGRRTLAAATCRTM